METHIYYRGYTIEPSAVPGFLYYETNQGIQHNVDYDGERYTYKGNCKWSYSVDYAKSEIDYLLIDKK